MECKKRFCPVPVDARTRTQSSAICSDKPKRLPFDPAVTGATEYPITEYQPTYYVTDSFESAQQKLM